MLFLLLALGPILTGIFLLLREPGCSRLEWITRLAVALAVLTLGRLLVERYSNPSEILYETFFELYTGFVITCAALGYCIFVRFFNGSIRARLTSWHAAGDLISALKLIATFAVVMVPWASALAIGCLWAFLALITLLETPLLCAAYLFGSVLGIAMYWPAIRYFEAKAKAVKLAT